MTQYTPTFGASGTGHSEGSVPDPGASAGTSRFLREDATWQAAGGVASVTATAPLSSSGGSNPDISLTGIVGTTHGGLGIDTSAFTKGSMLSYSGSAWGGNAPGSDGLVMTSDSSQPGGVAWATAALGVISSGSVYITSNFTLSVGNVFYDVATFSCSAGTWLVLGAAHCYNSFNGRTTFTAGIWDGTTTFASACATQEDNSSVIMVQPIALFTLTSTKTIRLRVCSTNNTGNVNATAGANSLGTNISGMVLIHIS